MNILLAGSTGLVGSHILKLLVSDPKVVRVICPTRNPIPTHPKVVPMGIQDPLPALGEPLDAYLCALGTTIKKAGSRDAFQAIDLDLVLQFAKLAREAGATRAGIVSAVGADARSSVFYNRVKGSMEEEMARMGFAFLTFARPSLLLGDRQEFRFGERVATILTRPIFPLIPKAYRPIQASQVAKHLVKELLRTEPGVVILDNSTLHTN